MHDTHILFVGCVEIFIDFERWHIFFHHKLYKLSHAVQIHFSLFSTRLVFFLNLMEFQLVDDQLLKRNFRIFFLFVCWL